MRGQANVTLPQAYCISLSRKTALSTHIVFTLSSFSISSFVFSAMDGKIEQRVCLKFCLKLVKTDLENIP
jgi:hypothetical protein